MLAMIEINLLPQEYRVQERTPLGLILTIVLGMLTVGAIGIYGIDLKNQLAENSNGLAAAKSTASELVSLKDQIVAHGDDTEAARTHANRMFVLQDELKTHGPELPAAFSNLDRLVAMKDKLLEQTASVADAVQNLEILSDFREELGGQIQSLTRMREGLLQIVLMESTLGRVAKALEPLSQIANVRRLSDVELREAARSILENRSTKITSKPETPRPLPQEGGAAGGPFIAPEAKSADIYEVPESGDTALPVPLPVTTN